MTAARDSTSQPRWDVVTLVLGLAVAVGAGCVTSESRVRVVSRAGALRGAASESLAIVPATIEPVVRVEVGADAATDAELAAIEAGVVTRLQGLPVDKLVTAVTARVGALSVVRARVKALPGREQHRYLADCRLRLRVDGDVVAEVEGETLRMVRARNLSVVELDGIKEEMAQTGRLTLLDADDVAEALAEACTAAYYAVVDDRRPDDADAAADKDPGDNARPADERALERHGQRRRALERLAHPKNEAELASAIIDLADVGVVDDAPLVAARLDANSALVRRAADSTFDVLCAGHKTLAPTSTACLKPTPPALPTPTPTPMPTPMTPAEKDSEEADDDAGPIRGATEPPALVPAGEPGRAAPAPAAPAPAAPAVAAPPTTTTEPHR